MVDDGHDNDEYDKQAKHASGGQKHYVKNIEVRAMLVEVDEQEQADEIERNHV